MKILNLYAGIGGNRKLWGDEHEIIAVENDSKIAKTYQDFFPNDKVITEDAHKYLLEHFKEFDFIWSSPPCPTHSRVRFIAMGREKNPQKPIYPDMKLYEEILLLQNYCKNKFCVENVVGFYDPLIIPQEINNHYFWTNFFIQPIPVKCRGHKWTIEELEMKKGFNLSKYSVDKRTVLRNCVDPETGLHIFQEAFREKLTLL